MGRVLVTQTLHPVHMIAVKLSVAIMKANLSAAPLKERRSSRIQKCLLYLTKTEPETNFYCFTAENTFIDFDAELDYAVLELNPETS